MIAFGRDVCGKLDLAARKEWLETNGLGGYASGTVAGLHTRSYHALLAASTEPPLHRVMLLSQLEETAIYRGQKYPLSTHQYQEVISPHGYLHLEEFRLDPFPVFVYRLADVLLEKRVLMTRGHNLTWILYRLLAPVGGSVQLSVRPQMNFRGLHLRKRERHFINTHHDVQAQVIHLIPDGNLPTLHLYHNAQAFEHSALWYQHLLYIREKERNLECEEDLFSPGVLGFELSPEQTAYIAATVDALEKPDPEAAAQAEVDRRSHLVAGRPESDAFGRSLLLAADQFLVRREQSLSVLAGYPWLGDCGRDALISLPGLTLSTGRYAEARAILTTFAHSLQDGLVPNHFTEETSQADYNAVDASLWLFQAVYHYLRATGDHGFVRKKMLPKLREIADFYVKGTRYRIRMDDDGLINLPEEAAQMTWMEAQVGDWIITPRSGKPVEVNALWYNALCLLRDLAEDTGEREEKERWAKLADKVLESFNLLYWNEERGCLFDRIEENFQDPTLRPNQLFAFSLPYPLVTGERAQKALALLKQELLTSFGFRTLEPRDAHYRGKYEGDLLTREGASYQGTVWPWLLGPYADALVRLEGSNPRVQAELRQLLAPFQSHLREAGLGTLSEMFDGDPPHTARGCIARAWSVAEILRVHLDLASA